MASSWSRPTRRSPSSVMGASKRVAERRPSARTRGEDAVRHRPIRQRERHSADVGSKIRAGGPVTVTILRSPSLHADSGSGPTGTPAVARSLINKRATFVLDMGEQIEGWMSREPDSRLGRGNPNQNHRAPSRREVVRRIGRKRRSIRNGGGFAKIFRVREILVVRSASASPTRLWCSSGPATVGRTQDVLQQLSPDIRANFQSGGYTKSPRLGANENQHKRVRTTAFSSRLNSMAAFSDIALPADKRFAATRSQLRRYCARPTRPLQYAKFGRRLYV